MKKFSAFALLLLSTMSTAQARQFFDQPNMIDVGAGAAFLGEGRKVEALFRVEAQGGEALGHDTYFIWARINGQASAGTDGVSYIDMRFDAIGYQEGHDTDLSWGANLLGLDVQRNVAINNDLSVRITLAGLRGSIGGDVSDDVNIYLKGAIDILGIGFSQRRSDGANTWGAGTGLEAELGVKLFKRVRIAVGEKFGTVLAKPENVYVGQECTTYYDDFGIAYTRCQDDYATRWNDQRYNSNTYLSLMADLTENIFVFGQANYNLYVVNDNTNDTQDSSNGAWQFFVGVGGSF